MIGAITAGLFSAGTVASTNSYESIATVTVGAGGSSTVTFSSIPSTYKHLQIRAIGRSDAAGNGGINLRFRFNSDTGTNYSTHQVDGYTGAGSGVEAAGTANTTFALAGVVPQAGHAASIFSGSVIDILDYQNTNKYKTTRSLNGYNINNDTSGYDYVGLFSSSWRSTSAISQVDLICSSGSFVQYSSFALYGIKG